MKPGPVFSTSWEKKNLSKSDRISEDCMSNVCESHYEHWQRGMPGTGMSSKIERQGYQTKRESPCCSESSMKVTMVST
ncbi:hypothetical protein ACTXT7_000791 [Hymenolepis weldensis]